MILLLRTYGTAMPENSDETPPLLKDLLPSIVLALLTGNRRGPDAIQEWSLVKRIPFWTVYVLTSDPTTDAAPVLQHLFRDIPCRFFSLQRSDFFPQQVPDIQHVPLYLLSSLYAVLQDAQQDEGPPPSVLLLDTKCSHSLEYVACRGTQILGYGTGPSLNNIPLSGPKHVFSLSQEPTQNNVSSYLQLVGIVNAWEHQTKGSKQVIWICGSNPSKVKLMESVLLHAKGAKTAVRHIADLVHLGIDAVLQEQTHKHGELDEPLDRLLVGQRVKIMGPPFSFGTIRNPIPREKKNTSIREYQYNVEFDHGKRQQVLTMDQVMGAFI